MARNVKTKKMMRQWHGKIGYLTIGLMLVYSISGFIMSLDEYDFLKKEQVIKTTLSKHLSIEDIVNQTVDAYDLVDFEVNNNNNGIVYFNSNCSYNSKTGELIMTVKNYPFLLKKISKFHQAHGNILIIMFGCLSGVLLTFLAISSFWMLNKKGENYKKNIAYLVIGIIISILMVVIV